MNLRAGVLVPVLLLLVACGGEERVTAASVVEQCDPESSYLELSSDEKAIEYNFHAGTEKAEAVYYCLWEKTGAPSSVDYRMMETRPIDGPQTASWDGWEVFWSYEGKSEGSTIHLSEV
ncbi:hypothetical protein LSF60_10635 [Rhodococcus pyridinivorans]|uniref:hypothetical protein n=1 Tax=Rhodococcus pyridinivorans TaxID=103816 RepID=UPI001E61BF1B|nr:hypothetical protein [Rhodococcus pyridinivorans]UGQ59883.1 hypothetical protein LSF60_10635 [Rhodococcus pyridinivorans]